MTSVAPSSDSDEIASCASPADNRSSSRFPRRSARSASSSSSPGWGAAASISSEASRNRAASASRSSRSRVSVSRSAACCCQASYAVTYAARAFSTAAPPKPSSAARCAVDEVRRIWSDCPWTVTSWSASSPSTATGALRPPTVARLRPSADTVRVRMSSPSSTDPPASSTRSATAAWSGTSQRPSTTALDAPRRTEPASARAPRSSPSAVTIMVLPAPVSPVTTVNPGPSSSVASPMTPRSEMRISSITGRRPRRRAVDHATPRRAAGTWRRAGR